MDKLNKLYDLAEKQNYDVIDCDLSTIDQKGMVFKIKDKTSILIDYDKINTVAEEKVITAHEIAHAETNAFYNLNSTDSHINKCEYQATKWAVKNLIPFSEYLEALKNGIIEKWQLAEYFNVTEDFILKTHYIYQCQGMI